MKNRTSRVNPNGWTPSLLPDDEWLSLDVRVHLIARKQVQIGFWVRDEWRDSHIAGESGKPRTLTLPQHPAGEVERLVQEFLTEFAEPFPDL